MRRPWCAGQCSVCPGWVKKEMDSADQAPGGYTDADIIGQVPMAGFAAAEDIAAGSPYSPTIPKPVSSTGRPAGGRPLVGRRELDVAAHTQALTSAIGCVRGPKNSLWPRVPPQREYSSSHVVPAMAAPRVGIATRPRSRKSFPPERAENFAGLDQLFRFDPPLGTDGPSANCSTDQATR